MRGWALGEFLARRETATASRERLLACFCSRLRSDLIVDLLHEQGGDDPFELRVVHEAGEDVLVLVHAVDEQPLERPVPDVAEVLHFVGSGRLHKLLVRRRVRPDLIEKELIRGREVGPECTILERVPYSSLTFEDRSRRDSTSFPSR